MSNQNDLPVITISREYGAGGRSVAKALSEKLGIPWYDQDFITETARDSGYSIEDIKNEGEEFSHLDMFIDKIMNNNVTYNSSHDKIRDAQENEILKLSEKPCIIVGRLSNIILKNHGIKAFNVFLHADIEHRKARIAELKENGKANLEKFIEKRDALRHNYYKYYTKHDLGAYEDYTLIIDTGAVGIDKAVEMIAAGLGK